MSTGTAERVGMRIRQHFPKGVTLTMELVDVAETGDVRTRELRCVGVMTLDTTPHADRWHQCEGKTYRERQIRHIDRRGTLTWGEWHRTN